MASSSSNTRFACIEMLNSEFASLENSVQDLENKNQELQAELSEMKKTRDTVMSKFQDIGYGPSCFNNFNDKTFLSVTDKIIDKIKNEQKDTLQFREPPPQGRFGKMQFDK